MPASDDAQDPTPPGEAAAVRAVLAADLQTGNGDDAAVVELDADRICVSVDAVVEGVHVPDGFAWRLAGRRAAARALSDLAAMGATPLAATCALLVPDGRWADAPDAVAGVRARAAQQSCPLVGGDMSAGSHALAITVTCIGVPPHPAAVLRHRSGMRPGDELWVTGRLGAARAALRLLLAGVDGDDPRVAAFIDPPDRIPAGRMLAPVASAMIDVSDGVAREASLLAAASGCGVVVHLDQLPLAAGSASGAQGRRRAIEAATGGDDLELLVAARPGRGLELEAALQAAGLVAALTCIGRAADTGLRFLHEGADVEGLRGFEHGIGD